MLNGQCEKRRSKKEESKEGERGSKEETRAIFNLVGRRLLETIRWKKRLTESKRNDEGASQSVAQMQEVTPS